MTRGNRTPPVSLIWSKIELVIEAIKLCSLIFSKTRSRQGFCGSQFLHQILVNFGFKGVFWNCLDEQILKLTHTTPTGNISMLLEFNLPVSNSFRGTLLAVTSHSTHSTISHSHTHNIFVSVPNWSFIPTPSYISNHITYFHTLSFALATSDPQFISNKRITLISCD